MENGLGTSLLLQVVLISSVKAISSSIFLNEQKVDLFQCANSKLNHGLDQAFSLKEDCVQNHLGFKSSGFRTRLNWPYPLPKRSRDIQLQTRRRCPSAFESDFNIFICNPGVDNYDGAIFPFPFQGDAGR